MKARSPAEGASDHYSAWRRLWWGMAAAACAITVIACGSEPAPRVTIGKKIPAFSLPSLAGSEVSSSALEGQMVVLNFWATWCQPCLKEIPELIELSKDERFAVVGIALDTEGERAVRPFVERMGMDYTILLGDQEIFQGMGGYSIPYTLVLDATQTVINVYRGPATRSDIEKDLEKVLARVLDSDESKV